MIPWGIVPTRTRDLNCLDSSYTIYTYVCHVH